MNYNPLPISCTIRPSWIEGLGVFAIKEIRNDTNLGALEQAHGKQKV